MLILTLWTRKTRMRLRTEVISRVKAVFLDRDGVLIENRADYVKSWEEVRILAGVPDALMKLHLAGYALVIITNQSAAGRGIMTIEAILGLNDKIVDELNHLGGWIDKTLVCYHNPEDQCDCRKPKPGMIIQAQKEMNIDLDKSYLIGDAITDLQAAHAVGVNAILVCTGRGIEQRNKLALHPNLSPWVVENILMAANYIAAEECKIK